MYRNYPRITIEYPLLLIFSIEELSRHQEDIIIHSDCDDISYDVARYYIEETGALGEVPKLVFKAILIIITMVGI